MTENLFISKTFRINAMNRDIPLVLMLHLKYSIYKMSVEICNLKDSLSLIGFLLLILPFTKFTSLPPLVFLLIDIYYNKKILNVKG